MTSKARADRPYLSRYQCNAIAAAAEVLLDTEAVTEREAYALARIAASGRYYPAESALVRLALASYADAHAT